MQRNINQSLYLQPQSKLCLNLKEKWRAALLSSNCKLHLQKATKAKISFHSAPECYKLDQSKNQLSSRPRMLQAFNIETTLVENYHKLRKQLKIQNFVNYNDYKIIIAKLEVKLWSTENILLKELSKREKLILMDNNVLNVVPETNCDTKKYNDIPLKLKYMKNLKEKT